MVRCLFVCLSVISWSTSKRLNESSCADYTFGLSYMFLNEIWVPGIPKTCTSLFNLVPNSELSRFFCFVETARRSSKLLLTYFDLHKFITLTFLRNTFSVTKPAGRRAGSSTTATTCGLESFHSSHTDHSSNIFGFVFILSLFLFLCRALDYAGHLVSF